MYIEKLCLQFKENIIILSKNKLHFLLLFLIVFLYIFSFFSIIGFVPEYTNGLYNNPSTIKEVKQENKVINGVSGVILSDDSQRPLHITIPDVGVNVNIENPKSRDIAVLDKALNKGAVRYPGTGSLTQNANIFLFGHSSFLPNIMNKNYQAFNGLRKLKGGEEIFVDSIDTRYVYRVRSVKLAEAGEIVIDLRRGKRRLTLSTCNSFGDESERYVVDADFVRTESL